MPKVLQYILIFVCIGGFLPFATAQDAFDETVEKIKALETKLEDNRKRVDQKTAEFRRNHKSNRPKDQFDSDASYKELMAELDVAVSNYRLELLKESIEKDQIELARLHREHIPSNDITMTLDTYNANSEFFPIIFKTPTERFTERLAIKRDDARILHKNWDEVRKTGYLMVGPAPEYQRILAKVTWEYPDLWRQPVTWHFNDSDTMVLIPAGDFEMGSNDGDAEDDEKPVHTVYLDAYYIDKYEVTVGQYKEFVQETGYRPLHWQPGWDEISKYSPTDQYPIIFVSWYDAMAYSKWVGKRLPTEAEWEKAARGGLIGAKYPWRDVEPNGIQCEIRRTMNHYHMGFSPVGRFPANSYGLHDTVGNSVEWCLDEYQEDFYARSQRRNPFPESSINSVKTNFTNIKSHRVLRGAIIASKNENLRQYLRVVNRSDYPPESGTVSLLLGFRCVRDVTP